MRQIKMIPLIDLDLASQMKIREIRNEKNVRKWMFTDHIIGEKEHMAWINNLMRDDSHIVFVVLEQNPVGVVSVNEINHLHKTLGWAYYLTETARGGLGSTLEYFFIDYIFGSMGMEKLNCEVIEGNHVPIVMHGKFLFKEEGFKRSNLLKNGVRIGVHLLGLTKEDWINGRDEIRAKRNEVFERFSISIKG